MFSKITYNIINLINLNLKRKKLYVTSRKHFLFKKYFIVLNLLINVGILKNYYKLNHKIILVFNFVWNTFFFTKIKLLSTQTKRLTVSIKVLNLLKFSNNYKNMWLLSNYGLISFTEAIKRKTGGLALFLVY